CLVSFIRASDNGNAETLQNFVKDPFESPRAGYVSDGDVLNYSQPGDFDASGYMSEGGITLYARKMQDRFREGLEAVRNSISKPSDVLDDRVCLWCAVLLSYLKDIKSLDRPWLSSPRWSTSLGCMIGCRSG
ncbi:unnamed protein product, partial [Soboliphyme baturini]|uniref:Calpain catalytic domain-containing protein n=1 Tax=Soboliphyme baturini TaxID=241478 RepID=A0A183IMX1_9BILA